MRKIVLFAFILISVFAGCKREDAYNEEEQLKKDEQLIKEFIAANNINATRHPTGMYYVISQPGTGNFQYTVNTVVKVKYTLRLLDGTVIPQTTEAVSFPLGGVIPGWKYGVPLIQKGGKIRLLIPSVYAYGPQSQSGIPANSVLDFDIELIDITN